MALLSEKFRRSGNRERRKTENKMERMKQSESRFIEIMQMIYKSLLLESKTLENQDAVMELFDGEYQGQHRKALSQLSGKTTEFIFVTSSDRNSG
jgi:hypothetical protein